MADSGVDDAERGTDETFDSLCSKCQGKGRNNEAEKFCVDCNCYYSSACVQSHNEFPALITHNVIDKAQFKQSSIRYTAVPIKRCRVHVQKIVDMYCLQHDKVACSTCMDNLHSRCKDKFYVPDFINDNSQYNTPEDTAAEFDTLANTLTELQNAFVMRKEMLKSSHENSLMQIKQFRELINQQLDELENNTIQELEQIFRSMSDKVDAQVRELQAAAVEVEAGQKSNSMTFEGRNASQIFVVLKTATVVASRAKKGVDTSQVNSNQMYVTDIAFLANQKLQPLLKEMHVLGSIQKSMNLVLKHKGASNENNENNSESRSSSLLQIRGNRRYGVKVESDIPTCSCNIISACTLDDGTILIADHRNIKLKRLDSSSYNVTDYCDVPEWPHQVCAINNQEAAVTCDNSQLIQFVSVEHRMKTTRQITTGFTCTGLAYADGKLFVSDWYTSVYVYNIAGNRLQKLSIRLPRQGFFSAIRNFGEKLNSDIANITFSSDKSKMYIADQNRGLVILNNDGDFVRHFKGTELKEACSVCLNKDGSVLVCGRHSQNVVQFEPDGNMMGEILKTEGKCQAVCYDKKNSKLIVCLEWKDEIEVYDVS